MPEPLQSVSANTVSNAAAAPSQSSAVEKPTAGKKRSHEAVDPSTITIPGEEEGNIVYENSMNCNVIRNKIWNLIDSGEVKVSHWQREVGINSKSYGNFMKLKGPWSGIDNQTYHAAYLYFKKRQLAGVKEPNKNAKKRKSNDGTATSAKSVVPDLSDISLPGEDNDKVEVYDSCNEIRRKISAHLRKDGVTQAGFLRTLGEQYHIASHKLQGAQLKRFRESKGADGGKNNPVFYAAYVYFEKLRLKEGKAKSKHREDMEKVWKREGGLDIKTPSVAQTGIWCRNDEWYKVNSLGQVEIHGPQGSRTYP